METNVTLKFHRKNPYIVIISFQFAILGALYANEISFINLHDIQQQTSYGLHVHHTYY